MTLIKFLVRQFPQPLALAVLVSLLGGLSTVAVLLVVIETLNGRHSAIVGWETQLAVLGFAFVASRVATALVVALIDAKAVGLIRTQLVEGILSTPLHHLETIGTPRLVTTLTRHALTISAALPRLALLCTSLTIVAGYVGYLSWLSPTATLAIGAILMAGGLLHWTVARRAFKYSWLASQVYDKLSKDLEALTLGIKQLKLNRQLADHIREELLHSQEELRQRRFQALTISNLGGSSGRVAFLLTIGVLLSLARSSEQTTAQGMMEFVFVFLYMAGPLESAMGALSALGDANVAFARVRELGLRLTAVPADSRSNPEGKCMASGQALELRNVTYRYREESGFRVGPLDLIMRPGEVVFVAGANGSGKTTFVKLLTGLYSPDDGEIFLGERQVREMGGEWYRQHFSAVFDDTYLFRGLADRKNGALALQAQGLLPALGLDKSVVIKDGMFSTTTALSRGQKKRLALLAAYLEDKPIYVFDEWAADQDPASREFFYREFLPNLRSKGKLVVAITHDEQYYLVADRILRFRDGKVACSACLRAAMA